jgi:hypothetical protein
MATALNPTSQQNSRWPLRVIAAPIIAVVISTILAIGLAVFQRWWALRIAEITDGHDATFVGVLTGAVVTFTASALFLISTLAWNRRGGPGLSVLAAGSGLVCAVPVGLTLAVYFGIGGDSAHSAQRTFESDAPGFEVGFIVGVMVAGTGYTALALVLGAQIRAVFGNKKPPRFTTSVAAPIGYTDTGEPIYPQVGYTPDGRPVLANQVQGPLARPGQTNTFAIVALVLGFFGGFLAIPFGHIALSQIRRTGEAGRGIAIAGLVLGYLSLISIVALAIFVLTAVNG